MIGYWTLGAWFSSVCAAAAQIVMPMAVGIAWGHAKAKKVKLNTMTNGPVTIDPEKRLCESWSIGRLRPWLQMLAERELSDRLRGRVDASDIVQQTLLKAWQGESQFKGETQEQRLAWLRTILKNTIRDQHRRLVGSNTSAARDASKLQPICLPKESLG